MFERVFDMKIIIINGSPRKQGATATILKEIRLKLNKYPHVEVETINLVDLEMNFCIGCCSCYKTEKCVFNDELEHLSHRIENADGLILGSPTYASNMSAQMKLLIDRGHFVMEQLLHKKYAVSVITYENYGGIDASKIMNKLLLFSGAQISGKIVAKLPFDSPPLESNKLRKKISKTTKRLYNDIQKQHNYLIQKVMQTAIFNFGIKPFTLKKGSLYSGVVNYWNEHGQL